MPEMLLRQSGFTYSDCGPITKNQNKNTKFKTKTENSRYIYWNELQKTCFKHDMVYGDFKVLIRRTASDKVLHAAFAIASNPHWDGYQGGLASVVYNFLTRRLDTQEQEFLRINNSTMNYTSLSLEILKSIRGADLAGMQLIIKCNNEVKLLLCVIDIYSENAWVVLFKHKNPSSKYMLKFNNSNTRTRSQICSKLTIKILQ